MTVWVIILHMSVGFWLWSEPAEVIATRSEYADQATCQMVLAKTQAVLRGVVPLADKAECVELKKWPQ